MKFITNNFWTILVILSFGFVGLYIYEKMNIRGSGEGITGARKEQVSVDPLLSRPSDDKNTKYLSENAQKAGVQVTKSGLQYKVLTSVDSGARPNTSSVVTVQYEGKLVDGSVFDSSYERGEPATFALNQVIPGWTEGVQLMRTGEIYEFTIPAALGYGPQGWGPIPGGATLIFKVELLDIQ